MYGDILCKLSSSFSVITRDDTSLWLQINLSHGAYQGHAVSRLWMRPSKHHSYRNCVKWCQSWSVSFPLWSLWKAWAGVNSSRYPVSLLVHYLTHPLARLTLEILFIALSGFSSAGPIRSISAPFEERITNISPLQPQTPHVQWHQWIPLMCQDEYVCKCVFIN